ncbi:MAG: GTPase Era [Candidatus Adiutrix sp.]|jgi:GTP-binding protein Era|nr:GTPase Era [Candidatus Adiutrix sp.]
MSPQAAGGHKAGFVAIVGAPNAGKSTLLNRLLGEKVAIVTDKPQTTRHRILGVLTRPAAQLIFWDTPGLHEPGRLPLNREMMNRALAALSDSDLALWVVDGLRQGPEHRLALEAVRPLGGPGRRLLAAVNKIDALPDKTALLPILAEIETAVRPAALVPVSAKTGDGLEALEGEIIKLLPENPPLYPEDALTDQPERAIAAEMIREAVFRLTSREVPYATAVTVDEFKAQGDLARLSATIHVERDSQKGIVIGAGGARLKSIGQAARRELERFLGTRVYLRLFVRATRDWSKKPSALLEFGYRDG